MNIINQCLNFQKQMDASLKEMKKKCFMRDSRGRNVDVFVDFEMLLNSNQRNARNWSKEFKTMETIIEEFLQNPESKKMFQRIFFQKMSMIRMSWKTVSQLFQTRQNIMESKVSEIKNAVEHALMQKIIVTGSVAAGTCIKDSDIDFFIDGPFILSDDEILRNLRHELRKFKLNNCYVISTKNLKLFQALFTDGLKLDVVEYPKPSGLFQTIKNLPIEDRMIISFLKSMFKSLGFINTQDGRLPSCFVSIALLCANNDLAYTWSEKSYVNQFLLYIAEFNFVDYAMTVTGPLKKTSPSSAIMIIDNTNAENILYNAAGRTTNEVMANMMSWCQFLSDFESLETYFSDTWS